jgi:Zn-dependent peptidase ImmA (M78 family)
LTFGNISRKQKETLCYQFAGAMLLPEETIKAELGEHRNKLSPLELGNIKKAIWYLYASYCNAGKRLWYH